MKKNGFTLIELLAVILILGIISLIAVPVVNNIVESAKVSSNNASINNIKLAISNECNTRQLNDQEFINSYEIKNGVISPSIEIKGKLIDGEYVVDNKCDVTYNEEGNSNKYVIDVYNCPYTYNGVEYDESCSIIGKKLSSYQPSIISVNFVDRITTDNEVVWKEDASINQDNSVIAWLEKNPVDNTKYDMYFGANGSKIYLNPNSYEALANMPIVKKIDFTNADTSKVINMNSMFYEDYALTTLNLSNFDTSNVTDMAYMFSGDQSITALDLTNFDTTNVTNMNYMFETMSKLTNLNISSFKTSNVTNMTAMFAYCSALVNLDLTVLDTSNVQSMAYMFAGSSKLRNLDFSNFNTENVIYTLYMFYQFKGSGYGPLDLSSFRTPKLQSMEFMFYNSQFSEIDIRNFSSESLTSVNSTFRNCPSLTKIYYDANKYKYSTVSNRSYFIAGTTPSTVQLIDINTLGEE